MGNTPFQIDIYLHYLCSYFRMWLYLCSFYPENTRFQWRLWVSIIQNTKRVVMIYHYHDIKCSINIITKRNCKIFKIEFGPLNVCFSVIRLMLVGNYVPLFSVMHIHHTPLWYRIQVSRVSYTMRRDGEIQDPNTVAPPTRNILYSTSLRDTSTTSVYAGSSLLPSDQRHSLLLNTVVDMNGPDGDTIRNNIQLAWENFRQSTPGCK